jgi:hypothetical protein
MQSATRRLDHAKFSTRRLQNATTRSAASLALQPLSAQLLLASLKQLESGLAKLSKTNVTMERPALLTIANQQLELASTRILKLLNARESVTRISIVPLGVNPSSSLHAKLQFVMHNLEHVKLLLWLEQTVLENAQSLLIAQPLLSELSAPKENALLMNATMIWIVQREESQKDIGDTVLFQRILEQELAFLK